MLTSSLAILVDFFFLAETPEIQSTPVETLNQPPLLLPQKSFNSDDINEFKFTPPTIHDTDSLLTVPQEMQIYLFGALSPRYLKELIYAFEQINMASLNKTLHMILSCCYCNESFSSSIIHQILWHVSTASSNEIKQALALLNKIVSLEDPLQSTLFKIAIDNSGKIC